MKNNRAAFILNAERNGLGIARSLGEIGVQSIFADKNPLNVGFASKYCLHKIIDYRNDEELLRKLILKANELEKKPVLFAASDEGILLINSFHDTLKEHFLFLMPDFNLTYQLVNKELTCKLACSHKVNVPKSYFLDKVALDKVINQVTYPCIIKPHFSHIIEQRLGRRLFVARSRDDLRRIYALLSDFRNSILAQEIIKGGDDKIWFFGGYFNSNSQPLVYFTGRKLRQCPIEFGSTSLAEYYPNSEVENIAIEFLQKINFKGLCDVEFKQGMDGKYYLMEINPRAGLWHRLGNLIGKDIIQAYYCDLTGSSHQPSNLKGEGKWMAEDRDVISALKYARKGKISLKGWLNSLRGKKIFSLWDRKDMKPFFYYFFRTLPRFLIDKHFRKKMVTQEKRAAFILSQFPCYDETFIMRELNELKNTGLKFKILSLKSSYDEIVHNEADSLMRDTFYLPFFSLRILAVNLLSFTFQPFKYLSTLFRIVFSSRGSLKVLFRTFALWPKAVGFAWLCRKDKISHIHGEWATYPATVSFIISRLNNVPFSFTGHAHDIYVNTTGLKEKIREAKFITTCTANNKKHLLELMNGRPKTDNRLLVNEIISDYEKKIIVNYHGVDLKKFNSYEGKIKSNSRSFSILSVGSLLPCKGFDILIEAGRILKDKGVDFECIIAGGGPRESNLKAQVKSLRLEECIRFTGYIRQEELISLYKQADVFALPVRLNIHWGIPNVLLEAMAAKLAVVTTNLPSISELIEDGRSGFIIPQKDPLILAETIVKLYKDKILRKRLGENGYGIVEEKFNLKKNSRVLAQLFELC